MPTISIEEAIDHIKHGRMIILSDDEDRENEGDFVIAAEFVTPEAINFMAKYGRGLICVTLTQEKAEKLHLDPMAAVNEATYGTDFTISVDAREGHFHGDLRLRPIPHHPEDRQSGCTSDRSCPSRTYLSHPGQGRRGSQTGRTDRRDQWILRV
ncbi:3,4-dihydroxy-2-butanone 4-phosphate synthase/GTP cyclohydrolase II, partial [mine drainage metagenome]